MIENFLSFLLCRFNNQNQAFSDPCRFAHICGYWEQIGQNQFHSKHWYNYQGEDTPYREKYHCIEVVNDFILVKNYTMNWEKYPCDMLFAYVDTLWEGVNYGECIVNDAKLESRITLTKDKILCYDAGVKDDKIVWGGRDMYVFDKL